MGGLRELLQGPRGRAVGVGFAVIAAAVLLASVWRSVAGDPAAAASRERVFICAATGQPYELELAPGQTTPAHSPHSDQATGYPAELCYWTADGSTKDEPTPVLLNSHVGKADPTFCPDCGRLVVGHNPPPEPGAPAPPTRDQYKPSKKKDLRHDQ